MEVRQLIDGVQKKCAEGHYTNMYESLKGTDLVFLCVSASGSILNVFRSYTLARMWHH